LTGGHSNGLLHRQFVPSLEASLNEHGPSARLAIEREGVDPLNQCLLVFFYGACVHRSITDGNYFYLKTQGEDKN